MITIDFETHPIGKRPDYPPRPVSLAIQYNEKPAEFLAWGHPEGNNCTEAYAREILANIWASGEDVLCHNAPFDLSVCYEYFKLPVLPWHRVHDTMFVLFLIDPHHGLGLKDAAVRHLGMPADEQAALHEYLWAHRASLPRIGVPISKGKMGAFIAYAPGDMVEPYALGDVVRTRALYNLLMPVVVQRGMQDAYDRERRLQPILMENERLGIRVDHARLETDVPLYTAALNEADEVLRDVLGAPGLSLDNDNDYADALASAGIVSDKAWKLTSTGRRSVAKGALTKDMYTNPLIHDMYQYRGKLATTLRMFLEPWSTQASLTGGTIHPRWHQVRAESGGTCTGRPSMSDPNLLNVAKSFEDAVAVPEGFPALPEVRGYMLPDEGHAWVHRDYDGQELRVYAHFERGSFYRMYRENPKAKPHDRVRENIKTVLGYDLGKTLTKNVNFGRIYGAGVPRIMAVIGADRRAAEALVAAHDKAMPDLGILKSELERMLRAGRTVRTLGGRVVTVEPARVVDGRMRDFYYKLLNHLVQGSAADMTKEAIIRWHSRRADSYSRLLLTVYDEINVSAKTHMALAECDALKDAMASIPCGVSMLSEAKLGASWGTAKEIAQ